MADFGVGETAAVVAASTAAESAAAASTATAVAATTAAEVGTATAVAAEAGTAAAASSGLSVGSWLSIASTLFGIGGTLLQGSQAEASARYNQKIAENNARMATAAAGQRAQAIRSSGERVTAEGTALLGGSGVDVNTGSPLIYQLDQIAKTDVSARQAEYEGQVKATGYGATAGEFGMTAEAQPIQTGAAVGKTVLTGAADVYRNQTKSGTTFFGTGP